MENTGILVFQRGVGVLTTSNIFDYPRIGVEKKSLSHKLKDLFVRHDGVNHYFTA